MKIHKQKERYIDYIRPRCKIILKLPFGLFIAKYVKIESAEGCSNPKSER